MTQNESKFSTTYTEAIEVKPAADVWRGPDPTDFAQQVEFFQREGFLVLRGLLDAERVDALKAEIDRLAREHTVLPRIREGFDLEPNQDATRQTPTFRKIGGITDHSEIFRALRNEPPILDLLHTLMGPIIELWRDVVMMKPARVGREKPWHQDSCYWPWEPMALISAMTALDDATPENGCLQIIPATHHQAVQHYGKELMTDIDDAMQAKTLYVPLKAGDVLLFHSLLLHASEPNHSDHDRRVCIISYKNRNVEFIGKGDAPDCPLVSDRSA